MRIFTVVFAPLFVLAAASAAHAGVPQVITYAGALEQNGAPANGTFSAVFTLFNDKTAGNSLFAQTESSLTVVGGAIVVDLGSQAADALDDDALQGGTVFLEVSIDGETLSPRVPLNAVPYARFAQHAADVNGLDEHGIAALNSADANGGLVDTNGAFGIADNGVTTARIQDDAVTAAKIEDGTITGDDVADDSIPFGKLDLTGHVLPLFGVPIGVTFCPNFLPSTLTVVPQCTSLPRAEPFCESLSPLPTQCTCVPNGTTQSFALCTFAFIGSLVK